MDPDPMAVTGERTVPGLWHENYWFRRHEVVYRSLRDQVPGRDVLDAGCGEGYGADLLAANAHSVCALDYDAYAAAHVRRRYPRLHVVRANLVALPFADATFDVVVSAQTIEHLWDQDAFIAECTRVLRPGGTLVVSTPNTLTFPPGNPYHPNELTPSALVRLVEPHLRVESVRGLHHAAALGRWEASHGSIVDRQLACGYQTWSAGLRARVADVGCDDFHLREPVTDDCLDVIVTARRHGRA
ncbi:MAG: class I SAM-dependent methyltransferase [Nocardioidaceae bacterium]